MKHVSFARRYAAALLASAAVVATATVAIAQPAPAPSADQGSDAAARATKFTMVRSAGAVNAGCLHGAGADVTVKELGTTEKMTIKQLDGPLGRIG